MNDKPTVLVVDNDSRTLDNFRRLLEGGNYCVETFASARDVLRSNLPDAPCCAIVDAETRTVAGLKLQSELLKKRPGMPVIFVSGNVDIQKAVRAMRAGAADFLVKPIDGQKLLDVVKRAFVLERRLRLNREERLDCCNRFKSLTGREKEVCACVARGKLNKQIAAELGICEKTVKVHRGRVMRKMGVESVADLVRAMLGMDGPSGEAMPKERTPAEVNAVPNVPRNRGTRPRVAP